MASDLNIPQFGTGATPGLNAPRMQAIWTFLKAIGSGGSGSVIKADDATKLAATTPSAVGLSMLSAADKAAQQALVSLPEVSDSGLVAHWSMDSVPEIPDDPAGVTTLSTNFTDAQGWTAINCTLSYSGGKMILTATAPFPGIYRAVTAEKTIRAKFKKLTGSATNSRFINTSGVIFTSTKTYDGSDIHDAYITTGATGNIQFYPGLTGSAIGDTFEISFVYIGTGAYLQNSLLDNSGNANHGTIYGATPVEGISGKALAFDGVNDYCYATPSVSGNEYSVSMIIKPEATTVNSGLFLFGQLTYSGMAFVKAANTSNFVLYIYRNSLQESIAVGSLTLDILHSIVISYNVLTKAYAIYDNGVLIVSGTTVYEGVMPISVFYLGYDSYLTDYFKGTIDEPRIYNRALSAEEVYSLYMSKGRGPDCQVKSVAPLKDSLVVRDPSGNIQANGFKFPGTQVASTDPNTLDDYEEGVFTPGISFGGASVGVTYTLQSGFYTKVGSRVLFHCNVVLSSKGSSTGNALITGLPFTTSSVANSLSTLSVRLSGVTFADAPWAYTAPATTMAVLGETTNTGTATALANSDFIDTSGIIISGHYYV